MTNPIIALWAHPRSMSTAIERTMRHRTDCYVFHEPFLTKYYQSIGKSVPNVDMEGFTSGSYEEIRSEILQKSRDVSVFIKDMSYHVFPEIMEDTEFSKRLFNVFLVRDPRKSIASFYKQDKSLTSNEIGYEAQWKHFKHVSELGFNNVMVVDSDSVGKDPKGLLGLIWERGGFSYQADAFDWSAKPFPEQLKNVESWHSNLIQSQGIYKDDRDPDSVFEAAASEAPQLREMLSFHQPFFDKLSAESVVPDAPSQGVQQ